MLYTNPLLEKFLHQAKINPHKKIIIETSGKSITIGKLAEDSLQVAISLENKGFKKNDKVLILVRPGISVVTFILAVMRLGGVLVVADPGMGKEVFENRIKLANPQWVFIESILFPLQGHPILKYYLQKRGFDIPEFSNFGKAKIIRVGLPLPGSFNAISYNSLLKKDESLQDIAFEPLKTDQDAMIVFTSGTTGMPKGVVHTVFSLYNTIEKIASITDPKQSDVFYAGLPHFLLLAVSLGVTAVVATHRFSPDAYMKDLQEYEPTILFGPPAEFVALVNYCRIQNISFPSYISKIFLGSAPVLSGFLKKLITVLPKQTEIMCMYGMTEILPVAVVDGRKKAHWEGEGDLLGEVVNGVKYKITDDELLLSGDNLFKNYLGSSVVNSASSGDLARVKDGKLILKGRKKDMIIKGNYNIYPALYESTIQKIPGVLACAMVGIYDEKDQDEKIIVAVELEDENKNNSQNIMKLLSSGQYSIDTNALPDKILVIKLPRFGRQSKIDKNKLKEIVKEKYL